MGARCTGENRAGALASWAQVLALRLESWALWARLLVSPHWGLLGCPGRESDQAGSETPSISAVQRPFTWGFISAAKRSLKTLF